MKMKLACVGVFAWLVVPAGYAVAADNLCVVAPQQCKILAEDEQVRVIEYTSKKGDKIPLHSHPKYIVYELGTGITKWTNQDGTTKQSAAGVPGKSYILKPTTHSQETLEDEHSLMIEIKK